MHILSVFGINYLNCIKFENESLQPLSVDSMALPSLYINMVFQIRIHFYLMNGLIDYYYGYVYYNVHLLKVSEMVEVN